MSDMAEEFGFATITPAGPAIAGKRGTWELSYTAGSRGLAVGASVRIYSDSDTDWEAPQFHDPSGDGYSRAIAPDGVRTGVRIESQRSWRFFVYGRDVAAGETITLLLGDMTAGSSGLRPQTFAEKQRFFWFYVDAAGDGESVRLDEPACLEIAAEMPDRLLVHAPSTVTVGETFRVLIKAEDRWGNPSGCFSGTVDLSGDGVEMAAGAQQVDFSLDDTGAVWVAGFTATKTGTLSLTARDDANGLEATSNPIEATDAAAEHQLLWADPHGGQLTLNSKIAEFYRYARDVAGVQFVGYQRNADAMSDEDWVVQQQEEVNFYEPGVFIPIPGFEWSGRTWQGGHHNVYFRRHGQTAKRNDAAEEMFQGARAASELSHITDVYNAYRNADLIMTPHVGGEHSDLTHHEPTLEPAVEMTSTHGSFEWMLRDAIKRRYRLGFLGGSDSYTARPGDDRPGYQGRRYSKAGLTGVYAKDISLESFFEAMKARRVFATTGVRMILRTEADGHVMGSEYTTSSAPTISVDVTSTGPLLSVRLHRGLDCIHDVPLERTAVPNKVRLIWNGSSRMTSYSGIVYDGRLEVTGGRIIGLETVRFDSPRSHVVEQTETSIRWHAVGCGYPQGFVIELDDPSAAVIDVSLATETITGPAYGGHGSSPPRRTSFAPAENTTFQIRVADLTNEQTERLAIGVLDRTLEASLDSAGAPSNVAFEFTDESPQPGVNPYWLRVEQTDGEMGWTSPVFVDYLAPVTESAT
jgi:hypothetical protein